MARLSEPGVDSIYAAAQKFVDAALRRDDSLFEPGRPIWSLSNLKDLHARFIGRPDASSRPFEVKLKDQLHDAGPDTIQLDAEVLYIHLLTPRGMHGETKRVLIEQVLSWSPRHVDIPPDLASALETGFASVGTAFMTRRPEQLQFLIESAIAWKQLEPGERDRLLQDPWAFRDFVFHQDIRIAYTQREALLHLVFPETFESVVSKDWKERIAHVFREHVPEETENVDRRLAAIREALQQKYGEGFHFYDPRVRSIWDPDTPWSQFIHWASRFLAWPDFEASERDYKLVIGEKFARARDAMFAGNQDWLEVFKQAFGSPNNLTSWRDKDRFLKWCAQDPQPSEQALRTLWNGESNIEERLDGFINLLPHGTVAMPTAFASVLLMADGPDLPVFRLTPFQKGFKLTAYPDFPPRTEPHAYYTHALKFLDRIIQEAAMRGLELGDRLTAQSLLWCITRWKPTEEPVASWPPADRRAYLRYRGDPVADDGLEDQHVDTWIYQANPNQYDIAGAVAELPAINWSVRQYKDRVHRNHTVYIWESGPDAGIIAVATATSEPGEVVDDGTGDRFNVGDVQPDKEYPLIQLRIDKRLRKRMLRRDLVGDPVLGDLAIIKMAQGTNFPVTAEQAAALHERVNDIEAHRGDGESRRTFADLMRVLEEAGLHFPEELVANYILALQTRRFVILSGISGTGKTRLAIALARYFQPLADVRTPVEKPDGAFDVAVQPYMVKHHQWAFRSELRHALHIPALESGETVGQIRVLYDSSFSEHRVFRDARNTFWQMSLTGSLRSWFDEHFEVGDHFFAEVVPAEDEGPDSLRLSVPRVVTRQAPLANYAVVAVRPDWTDHRGLLGFYNPLINNYTVTRFLQLLLDAQSEYERARRENRAPNPFFAVLDEMNLARVEHYFSDFLSALESGEPLDLHQDPSIEAGDNEENIAVPRRFAVPPNVFFTGTVNIDETTYMFSPKVLDRAFTLELNQVDLAGYRDQTTLSEEEPSSPLALSIFPDPLVLDHLPGAEDWDAFKVLDGGSLHALLLDLHEMLAVEHRHFGYRVANEIARFVALASVEARSSSDVLWSALDLATLQKVLPKFSGTEQELKGALEAVFRFAVSGKKDGVADQHAWIFSGTRIQPKDPLATGAAEPRLPRTATKVWRMLQRVERQGFTSFIE